MLLSLIKGFGTSCSLIIAIGAQNAFVIRQGLRQEHLLVTALLCSFIDAVLIALSVTSLDYFSNLHPLFIDITHYLAVGFLVVYGALSLKSALHSKSLQCSTNVSFSKKKTILTLLALTLLNPHVYLDTVVLLGSIVIQQPINEQIYFVIGAISASFIWFFSITYGASLFAPILTKASTWKIIDLLVALIMWSIASMLLL